MGCIFLYRPVLCCIVLSQVTFSGQFPLLLSPGSGLDIGTLLGAFPPGYLARCFKVPRLPTLG